MSTKKQRTELDELIAAKIAEVIPEDNNEAAMYIRTNVKEQELFASFKCDAAIIGLAMFQIAIQNEDFFESLQNAAGSAFAWKKEQLEKELQNKVAIKFAQNKKTN